MAKINQKTIDSVSIAEVKALESFIKAYNKNRHLETSELQAKVVEECQGMSDDGYQKFLVQSQAYLESEEVPTNEEWNQIKTLYRELGNKKIITSRENLEYLSKEYSGVASIAVSETESISPAQVVLNLKRAERGVEIMKTLKTVLTIFAGLIGFAGFSLMGRILMATQGENINLVVSGILAGVFSLCGLTLCAFIISKLMGLVVKQAKDERNLAEVAEAENHNKIVLLQTAIKTAEENKKKIETQYEVEILARTDFSSLLKPDKHKAKKLEKVKEIKPQENVEQQLEKVKTTEIDSQNNADMQKNAGGDKENR